MHPLITFKYHIPGQNNRTCDKSGFLIEADIDGNPTKFVVSSDGNVTHYETGRVMCYISKTNAVKRLSTQRHHKAVAAVQLAVARHGVSKVLDSFAMHERVNELSDL